MGRPIQKKWFGLPAKITVNGARFSDSVTSTDSYIIKQTGSSAYLIQDVAMTHAPEVLRLVEASSVNDLETGQCFINAEIEGRGPFPCMTIQQYVLSIFGDDTAVEYIWSEGGRANIGPISPPVGPGGPLPTITTAPTLSFGSFNVGGLVRVTLPVVTGYNANDGLYSSYYVRGATPLPVVGEALDFNILRPADINYFVLDNAEQGEVLSFFVAIYNPDFNSFEHVYPVFFTTPVIGAVDINQPPQPYSLTPPTMNTSGGFWSLDNSRQFHWLTVSNLNAATFAYQWYINGVLQVGFQWGDDSVNKVALNGAAIVGDSVYVVVTVTDDQGTATQTSATIIATALNLQD